MEFSQLIYPDQNKVLFELNKMVISAPDPGGWVCKEIPYNAQCY